MRTRVAGGHVVVSVAVVAGTSHPSGVRVRIRVRRGARTIALVTRVTTRGGLAYLAQREEAAARTLRGDGRRDPLSLDRVAHPAVRAVVVHDAAGLHRRIERGRPDEAEAGALEGLRKGRRLRRRATPTACDEWSAGRCDQKSSCSGVPASRRARVARAFAIAASILPRWRTIDASLEQPLDVALAEARDRSGSKPSNAARKASRLRRIVSHDSPDWKPSRQSRS